MKLANERYGSCWWSAAASVLAWRWPVAAPFAALATLAALNTPRRDLFTLVGVAWLANQSIGYGFLAYPQTWDSFAWGGTIGIAAALAAVAALVCRL